MQAPATPAAIPLTVYLHLPWCVEKCPYCDFNSHGLKGTALPEQAYVDALLADLEWELPQVWGRRPVSVFLGGGTPSLFSPAAVERLLSGLRARLPLSPQAEITLEANPGTVERGRFAEFRAAGINRLSIGVQSFAAPRLAALGRIHGPEEARRAALAAHDAGFTRFNLDLMFGLPGQDLAGALADLEAALALAPPHLSHYQLTLEPNTAFAARPPPGLPDEDTLWAMQTACQGRLAGAGYTQYEVSAFAQAGQQCRHNLNYWQFGDYLGLGAGAHGKLSGPDPQTGAWRVVRRWRVRHPRDYLAAAGGPGALAGERAVAPQERLFEFALNALRLAGGFPLALFAARTGLAPQALLAALEPARQRGLVDWQESGADPQIRPTPRGWRFLDSILEGLLPDAGPDADPH